MKIGVPKESRPGERRVAVSPESVKKFVGLGFDVAVEKGAGLTASFTDAAYEEVGATIAATAKAAMDKADVILKVDRPTAAEVKEMPKGAILACILSPFNDPEATAACAAQGVTAFAMEFMPRITRAQSMDVLSSQANLAGYRAVIDAAHEFARAFPMMMTAAGTVAPAKVFVMGAGVAGLQAIATARRLGAVVSATDVRRAAGEQVESLGAKFIMVETAEDMETAGGYAKELSEEDQKRQAELVADHVKGQDIVVTTALIPGRPAPKLITKAMVESMKPGSIVVDIAAAQGGNCELTEPDEIVDHGGVKIIGYSNVPSRVAMDASALYARNLFNFLSPMVDAETKKLAIDWEDELVEGTLATKDGAVVHPNLKDVVKAGNAAAKKPAAKKPARPKAATAKKPAASKANGKAPSSGSDQNDS
jgi:NAD(P) transhydrogenase subunit alpha